MRSMAPWRWAGFTLSRSVRQLSASRTLKNPTGTTCVPRRPAAIVECGLVIRTRPAGPSGQSPSRSSGCDKSSSTSSHGWLVSWQPADEARGDRFGRAGGLKAGGGHRRLHEPGKHRGPAGGGDPDQQRRRPPDRQSDSAMITAIWVLPHAPSQFCGPSAKAEPGTSATAEPGTSASTMPRAVSGRSVKPSASGGTSPTRNRRAPGSAGIPPEGTTARYPQLFICVKILLRMLNH